MEMSCDLRCRVYIVLRRPMYHCMHAHDVAQPVSHLHARIEVEMHILLEATACVERVRVISLTEEEVSVGESQSRSADPTALQYSTVL